MILAIAMAAGLCFTDVPHPNPQPLPPRDGSPIRQAITPAEREAYRQWYDHWRRTQFIRQWHECSPRPGGCLVTVPPSADVGADPRPVDIGQPIPVPEPWGVLLPTLAALVAAKRARK